MIPTDSMTAQARLPEIVPEFLSSWIGVLILLLGLGLLVLTIVEKLRPKLPWALPQPLETAEVERLATREEVRSMKEEIERDIADLREEWARERAKSHQEVVAIHGRINVVAENTSAMKGRLEEIARSLHALVERSMK